MPLTRRALATAGAACLAALAVAGCSQSGSSATVKTVGNTLAVYISEPSNLKSDPVAQDVVDAEKLAFSIESPQVKDYKLVLQTPMSATISDNARQAIVDKTAIALP